MSRDAFWRAQGVRFADAYRRAVDDVLEAGEAIVAVAPALRAKKLLNGAGFVTDRRLLLVSRDGACLSWEPGELAVQDPTASGIRVRLSDGSVTRLNAGDKASNLAFGAAVHGLVLRPSADPASTSWSGPVTYVGGHGTSLIPGVPYRAEVGGNGAVAVQALDGTVAYAEPEPMEIHVSGPGEYTTGGGWFGGGFGLSGAIKGAVMADVLNTLTTKRSVSTLLRISTAFTIVVLESRDVDREELAAALSSAAQAAQRRASTATAVPPSEETNSDLVGQLGRLAELHSTGALTDEEFASAKQRLLEGM